MKNKFKIVISLEKFFADAYDFDNERESDLKSYPVFLNYFRNLKTITEKDIIIGINFTYGWMPTIFKFGKGEIEKAVKILNSVKDGNAISIIELNILKELFNNSLVGTTKLLHFISPQNYAIWDSRVFRYLTGQEPYKNRLDNFEAYLEYNQFCHEISSQTNYQLVHNYVENKIGYQLTQMRATELVMYHKGSKASNIKKNAL